MTHELIVEGRIVDLEAVYDAQVGIDNGLITEIRKTGLKGEAKLDVEGCLIFPGFIDIHVHLREDGECEWCYKEDFKTGTKAAVHGGVTTVVDMPNTPKPAVNLEQTREKKRLAESRGIIPILFYGGVGPDNLSHLREMESEVVGYKIYMSKSVGEMFFNDYAEIHLAVKTLSGTRRLISFHCEDQRIIEENQKRLRGFTHPEIHCDSRPEEAEVRAVSEALALAGRYDVKVNICHVSTRKAFEMISREKIAGKAVTCEVTPHHLYFTCRDMAKGRGFLKMNPPLRGEDDRRFLLEMLGRGWIDSLATDHAPHSVEEKKRDIWNAPSGVPGLDTYGGFVSWLMLKQRIDPRIVMRVCSHNPARLLVLKDRGRIEIGRTADLAVIDLKKTEKITSDRLYTKCGWSPFDGVSFPGSVRYTIHKGRIMLDRGELLV